MINVLSSILLGMFAMCGILILFVLVSLLVMVIAAIVIVCINLTTGKCQSIVDRLEVFLDL